MSTQNHSSLYTLATIVKRLEAVASRFEDLEDVKRETRRQSTSTVTSFADAQTTITPPAPAPPAIVVQQVIPPSVQAFDAIVIEARLKPLVELTATFAPQVLVDQVDLFAQAILVLRDILLMAAACKKPDRQGFEELLNPLQASIEAVTRAKEANRKERDWFNHLTAVAEGAVCVGWITVEPKPAQYIVDIKESAMYYSNRIIKEFRDQDARHAEWVRALVAVMDEMKRYVLENHPTGLVWNASVSYAPFYARHDSDFNREFLFRSTKVLRLQMRLHLLHRPPPPPPPPPSNASPPPAASGVAAMFAELNRGEEVTKD
ncbi:adenylate cyclase-associated CAP [Boletus reticuloceps]|uniref:Adenylyl cyclase-associated protein n=1 Tax=Boletus reticuloceps TaxID=495285 RepID=A0A8I3ABR0_9AGAM|nr:adenylate cyclase-associated CAP [Boletus reticuloceps]